MHANFKQANEVLDALTKQGYRFTRPFIAPWAKRLIIDGDIFRAIGYTEEGGIYDLFEARETTVENFLEMIKGESPSSGKHNISDRVLAHFQREQAKYDNKEEEAPEVDVYNFFAPDIPKR